MRPSTETLEERMISCSGASIPGYTQLASTRGMKSDSPELKITIPALPIWNDHPCYRSSLIRPWYAGSHSPTRSPLDRCLDPDKWNLICFCALHCLNGIFKMNVRRDVSLSLFHFLYPHIWNFFPSVLSSWRATTFFSVSVPLFAYQACAAYPLNSLAYTVELRSTGQYFSQFSLASPSSHHWHVPYTDNHLIPQLVLFLQSLP